MPETAALDPDTALIEATPPAPADDETTALDQPISTRWLLKFSLPTILSTVAMTTFGMIDGVFASRVINPAALAAVNIVFPFLSFVMAVGFMLSIGGSALVAKKLGQGKVEEARRDFSLLAATTLVASIVLSSFGLLFPNALLNILGVDDFLRPMATDYLQPLLILLPFAMFGFFIQQFFVTEGKPTVGFMASMLGGVVNIGLNFLLIAHLQWELRGAAIATGLGYVVPAIVGVFFFLRNRGKGTLWFVRPRFSLPVLGQSSLNGASEMVTMLAMSFTQTVMNNILMDRSGHEAVAAAGIMFVGQGLLMAFFLGYASGVAPIISFNFGTSNTERLRRLFRRSMIIIVATSAAAIVVGYFTASLLTRIYVPVGIPIYDMAVRAFHIGLIGFVFAGVNSFASVLFTALNNGTVSAILSFMRTLVFVLLMLSLLPLVLDLDGVWLALPAAEVLALGVTGIVLWKMRGRYQYA